MHVHCTHRQYLGVFKGLPHQPDSKPENQDGFILLSSAMPVQEIIGE